MKKLISLFLALMLLLGVLAVPALAEEALTKKVGMLSMLNIDEAKMKEILAARRVLMQIAVTKRDGVDSAAAEVLGSISYEPVYFDTLQGMQMALTAGEIDRMEIYQTTAEYLCAQSDELIFTSNDKLDLSDLATRILINGILANDFTFMMQEGQEALRDEFNTAIAAIREDGTMDRLIADYIDAVNDGKEIAPIGIAQIDGAETIRVAITGSLPPMDYIAPDGTAAGFNTALLSEISRRLGKNIELVQVDSLGRAAALASGTVDVVFWTRSSSFAKARMAMSEEEKAPERDIDQKELPEEEIEAIRQSNKVDAETFMNADMPAGTIITEPYFSDTLVMVMTKTEADSHGLRK